MADFVKDGIIGNEHGIKSVGKAYVPLVEDMAKKWGIPEVLISHQIYRESSFNPNAISNAGAVGLMQILPGTAREIAERHGLTDFPIEDPYVNANLGMAYLTDLYEAAYKMFPDPERAYKLALVGYFAGPTRMRDVAGGDEMTKGEKDYVNNITWDFTRTEKWSQLKPPGVGNGFPWWILLLPVGYVVYKKGK